MSKSTDKRAAQHKGTGNTDRRNRKAWKRRPCCGKRHAPGACK
jgi:hypothetical protein